jgi:hypothetical protein
MCKRKSSDFPQLEKEKKMTNKKLCCLYLLKDEFEQYKSYCKKQQTTPSRQFNLLILEQLKEEKAKC